MLRYTEKKKKSVEPLHTAHVDNEVIGDNSGYLGLILNVNKKGNAIRIATRDGAQRVHVVLQDVNNLIEALTELKARGVATSVKEVTYDTKATNRLVKKHGNKTFSTRRAA